MATITIFGKGNMGGAIASVFAAGGHSVQHIDTATQNPTVEGDVVVLAVPYGSLSSIAEEHRNALAGKVVVDITNALDPETFSLVVPADSSAAAELAAALPASRVVKAFNTNFGATLASGKVGENRTTVLIAGDDAAAKQTLAAAITAGGAVDAIDAGPLARARELEALAYLQITLAATEQIGWTGGFAVIH